MLNVGDRVLSTLPDSGRKGTIMGVLTEPYFRCAPYYVQWDDGAESLCSPHSLASCEPRMGGQEPGPITVAQLDARLCAAYNDVLPVHLRVKISDAHGHSVYFLSAVGAAMERLDGTDSFVIEGELSL
jgi:hypothetical protein